MATKKKEIYARAAVQLRTHDRAREAERQCPGAMGLYLYLLLQSRGELTSGDVSEAAALESWGAPAAYRRRQVAALLAVGLVARRDDGRLQVVKYEEHNDTPEDVAVSKEKVRARMANFRAKERACSNDVTRDTTRTERVRNADVPISISSSLSGSESGRDPDPDRLPTPLRVVPRPDEPMAAWTAGAFETVEMSGGRFDRAAVWGRYVAIRSREARAIGHPDFLAWLWSEKPKAERERQRAYARTGTDPVESETFRRPSRKPYNPDLDR